MNVKNNECLMLVTETLRKVKRLLEQVKEKRRLDVKNSEERRPKYWEEVKGKKIANDCRKGLGRRANSIKESCRSIEKRKQRGGETGQEEECRGKC